MSYSPQADETRFGHPSFFGPSARTAYTFTNGGGFQVPVGYGSALFNNSGCAAEVFPSGAVTNPSPGNNTATCTGDVHHIVEGTLGFWHKFYQGPKGRLQWGLPYFVR